MTAMMTMTMMKKNDLEERLSAFLNEEFERSDGGLKKRRTAYSSGRREQMGMRRKRPSLRAELKSALGTSKRRKKSVNTQTPARSKQRWRKR